MPTLNLAINARTASAGGRDFLIILDRIIGTSGRAKFAVASIFSGLAGFLVLRQVTQVVAEFEQTMTTLRAVTNATDAEFQQIEETTRRLGATTRFAAREIAEAELIFARAGYSISESLVASTQALQLAQSSATGLATAADVLNSALHQFNLTGYDAKRVADALTIAANRTATDVQEMGEALKYAGTTAGLLGVSVEDTANLIGVLGDRGIRASIAGTNLRSVLLRLVAVTDDGRKSLAAYGISTRDVNTGTQDIVDVLERLKPLLSDSQAAVKLFTLRNVGAAQALIASTEKLRALRSEQERYAGETARIAKLQDQTLIGSFKRLRATLEEAALQIGDAGLSGGLKSLLNTFTLAARDLLGFKSAATATSEAAQNLSIAIAAIAGASLLRGVLAMTGAVVRLGAALVAAAVTNPFGLIIVAIGAAAGLVYKFRDSIVDVGGHMVRLGTLATEVFKAIGERVSLLAKFITTIAPEIFKMVAADVKSFLDYFQKNFGGVLEFAFNAAKTWASVLGTVWKDLGNILIGIFVGAFDAITQLFKTQGARIQLVILDLGIAMNDALEGNFDGASEAMDAFWEHLKISAGESAGIVKNSFKSAFDVDYVGQVGKDIQATFEAIGATFEEFLSGEGFKGGLSSFFDPFIIGAEAAAAAAKETAKQAASTARTWATILPVVKELAKVMPMLAIGIDARKMQPQIDAFRQLKAIADEIMRGPEEGDLGSDKNYSTILQQRGELERMNDVQLKSFMQSNEELGRTVDLFNLGFDAQKAWVDQRAQELDIVKNILISSGKMTSVEAERIANARKRLAADREALTILAEQVRLSQLLNNYRQFQGNVEGAAFDTGFDLKTLGLGIDALERANALRGMGVSAAEELLKALEAQKAVLVGQLTSLAGLNDADLARLGVLNQQTAEIGKQVADAKKLVEQQQALAKLRRFTGELASSLGNAADAFIRNLASGRDILKKLYEDIIATFVQRVVIDKLVSSLAGAFDSLFGEMFGVEKTLQLSSISAGKELALGGEAAGLAMVRYATLAASILRLGGLSNAISAGAGAAAQSMAGFGMNFLSSFFGGGTTHAQGGAFGPSGQINYMAQGEVVNKPTGFYYGGGKRGVLGEKGEEGILPLKRTSSGALGVQAEGGGDTNIFHVTIQAQDAASFGRNKRQITNTLADAVRKSR
jgi:TP901 family phage tail tape measure protein